MNRAPRRWLALAALSVALIVIAGADWARAHPLGTSWDESAYFEQVLVDLGHARDGGPAAVARGLLKDDATRPPMYRVLALPVSIAFGFSPLTLRLESLAFFVATLVLVFLAVRRLAGLYPASLSVLLLGVSPVMVASSIVFGTEYPLYFASAAMLVFLVGMWDRGQESGLHWLGLGLSLGLGALAKTTFALIALPPLVFILLLSYRGVINGPSVKQLAKAVSVGALIAFPWWAVNLGPALAYARYSGSFPRHSLGNSPAEELSRWLGQFVSSDFGPASTIFVISLLLVLVGGRMAKRAELRLERSRTLMLLICTVTAVPMVVSQLIGGNANTWHIAPALIFLSVGIGLVLQAIRWVPRWFPIGVALMLSSQVVMLLAPSLTGAIYPTESALFDIPPWLVMARQEQWDWQPLQALAESRGLRQPSIAFLGSGRQLNPPAVAFPWALRNVNVHVTWLWRYEDGPIDWPTVMRTVDASDVVLTTPGYVGDSSNKEDLDNEHNEEFVTRIEHDARFSGPVTIVVGRYEPVNVAVFLRQASTRASPTLDALVVDDHALRAAAALR